MSNTTIHSAWYPISKKSLPRSHQTRVKPSIPKHHHQHRSIASIHISMGMRLIAGKNSHMSRSLHTSTSQSTYMILLMHTTTQQLPNHITIHNLTMIVWTSHCTVFMWCCLCWVAARLPSLQAGWCCFCQPVTATSADRLARRKASTLPVWLW